MQSQRYFLGWRSSGVGSSKSETNSAHSARHDSTAALFQICRWRASWTSSVSSSLLESFSRGRRSYLPRTCWELCGRRRCRSVAMSAARLSSQLPTRPELLRARYEDVKDNPHERLVPILSQNPKPLYVRNLIRLLPRCDSTHEDINRLQRKHSFHYAYEESDTERKCLVIGYQFRENASADEIARGVQKLRASKRRLVESRKQWNPVYQREAQQRLQQRRARLQTRPDAPLLQRREGTSSKHPEWARGIGKRKAW